jgi:hypothetical protein
MVGCFDHGYMAAVALICESAVYRRIGTRSCVCTIFAGGIGAADDKILTTRPVGLKSAAVGSSTGDYAAGIGRGAGVRA